MIISDEGDEHHEIRFFDLAVRHTKRFDDVTLFSDEFAGAVPAAFTDPFVHRITLVCLFEYCSNDARTAYFMLLKTFSPSQSRETSRGEGNY